MLYFRNQNIFLPIHETIPYLNRGVEVESCFGESGFLESRTFLHGKWWDVEKIGDDLWSVKR